MSISSTVRKVGPFLGAGTSSSFPFSFKVFQSSDVLVVTQLLATGVQATLVLNNDYTVSLNPNQDYSPGGSITLLAGPLATGYSLVVTSALPDLQGTELTNQGGFYPEVLTASLDFLTILVQQLAQNVSQCLQIPITDPSTTTTQLPAASQRAGLYLSFDSNGNPIVTAGTGGSGGGGGTVGFADSIVPTGTIDGVNSIFFLPSAPTPPSSLNLFLNGARLALGIGYTLSGEEITYASGYIPQPGQVGQLADSHLANYRYAV